VKPVISRAIDAIARQKWLDKPAEALQKAFDDTMARFGEREQAVRDLLHGKWFEHPLHPGFTDIPVGAWTVAFMLDVAEGERPSRGADAAIAVGVLGAAGSAATGIADWRYPRDERVRRIGLVHAGLNAAALSLYITSMALRAAGMRSAGKRASYLGYGIISVSAYIGGHLLSVERQGLRHAPTDAEAPHEFSAVADESELGEGEPKRVSAGGLAVLLVRRGDEVFALTDECPHLGCSLAAGRLDGGAISCPCHGSRFRLADGAVLQGPSAYPATVLEARLRDGRIEVRRAGG
jgi:nitrite reductase/ring-hydroxylating ferredoxin subunit